jgi:hypothetical protein
MSCEGNRHKYFQLLAAQGADPHALERLYQAGYNRTAKNAAAALQAEAKTRLLFAEMQRLGVHPPTHSPSGLSKPEAQQGYAVVYDALARDGLIQAMVSPPTIHLARHDCAQVQDIPRPSVREWADVCTPDGRDADGYDRLGYDRQGFDRQDLDRWEYNPYGLDARGFNRCGYNKKGLDKDGYNAAGYNASLRDRDGYDLYGYDSSGRDRDGYDQNGYDAQGYDRPGFDINGYERSGTRHPFFTPDAAGIYADGRDAWGFDAEGYDLDGRDRFGFDRQGYNLSGYDRDGRRRDGRDAQGLDAVGYDAYGYRNQGGRRVDRLGYDRDGFDASGYTFTGYDKDGLDRNGQPRMRTDKRGKPVEIKYRSGWDANGYDRWGFHKDTGLSAPDEQGRQRNHYGWIYDEATQECFDPQDPAQRMAHVFHRSRSHHPVWGRYWRIEHTPYMPPSRHVAPPIAPFAPMTRETYDRANPYSYRPSHVPYEQRLHPPETAAQRWQERQRAEGDAQAASSGYALRCPRCGQFTGGKAHTCPAFHEQPVLVLHSGVVTRAGDNTILSAPHCGRFTDAGYDENGRDKDGRDRLGYDVRGFDIQGYTAEGYDLFGYDRDGYDRRGYDNAGLNRRGERRPRSLSEVGHALDPGMDLLANQDLANLYGRIATGLVGMPRRVVLEEGGGFATDMKGTIHADPYPLGREADPRHNLVLTRAGIHHELGHELFTSPELFAQVVAIADGKQEVDGLDRGRRILPMIFNIIEDGRMERQVSRTYAGVAETLAASCRLEPRWDEQVGEGIPDHHQLIGALLYTSLPYYHLRPELKAQMSASARALFDELEPVVRHGVHGSPEDAFAAALVVAHRFEQAGIVQEPDENAVHLSEPPPIPSGTQSGVSRSGEAGQGTSDRRSGDGDASQETSDQGSGSGQADQPSSEGQSGGRSRQGETGDVPTGIDHTHEQAEDQERFGGDQTQSSGPDPQDGKDWTSRQDENEGQSSSESFRQGAGGRGKVSTSTPDRDNGLRSPEQPFTEAQLETALNSVEKEAAAAIEAGIRHRVRPDQIGKPLQRPLGGTQGPVSQRYRGLDGMPKEVSVDIWRSSNAELMNRLQERRSAHRPVASRLAQQLKAIRQETEQRLRRQSDGRLDRRQLANAVKGQEDVYTQIKQLPRTSFVASLAVDMSGSMSEHIHSGALYDAAMVLGDTFEMLEVPYDVRAFGSHEVQFKSMGDASFAPDRAAGLAEANLGGTRMAETAGLAQAALQARPEQNRIFVSLTDGALNDHEQSRTLLADARKNGIVTFGIFLGEGADTERMDQLYGRGNWTTIHTLADMPKAVGQRLASIFKSLR